MKRICVTEKAFFAGIYNAYAPMVYRRCLFLLKDDSEALDMMQNTFLRIFEASGRLNLENPSSLLWNTATRLCLNRIRDMGRRGILDSSENLLCQIASLDDEIDRYEAENVLFRLFHNEPESSRTIAVLHFIDGMTLEETAKNVGLSVSGVRKRLRFLQVKLKNLEAI